MELKGTPETAPPLHAARASDVAPLDLVELVDRYQTPLLRYVSRLIASGAPGGTDIEDVVQDAFLRLHRQIAERGEASIGNVRVWLFRVAHNLAMDVGRKRSRHKQAHDTVAIHLAELQESDRDAGDVMDELAAREARQWAMDELNNLPDAMRQIVLLKVIEGLTMRQIAEVLGMSASNVCYRFNQAIAELAHRLKDKNVI